MSYSYQITYYCSLFVGMLQNSRYEAKLASTTLNLVHADLHSQLNSALKSAGRAVRPTAEFCSVCGDSFLRTAVIVFPCGHPAHEKCSMAFQCPVCATISLDRVSPFCPFS